MRSDVSRALVWLIALAFGLALLSTAQTRVVGFAFVIAGALGLVRHGVVVLEEWRSEEQARLRHERREAIRAQRRARRRLQRDGLATDKRAHAEANIRELERRSQVLDSRRAEMTAQLERSESAIARAERFKSLDESGFISAVRDALTLRGFVITAVADTVEANYGEFTAVSECERVVVRVAPIDRVVTRIDVESLDDLRSRLDRDRGYLVVRAVPSISAVNAVNELPISLVDPYMLAGWTLGGEGAS